MRSRNFWGVLLIVLGFMALSYTGLTYSSREKVIQVGSLVATADVQHKVDLPPWLGGVALVAGIAILAMRHEA